MSAKTPAKPKFRPRKGFDPESTLPVALFRASHPRQALLTAVLVAVGAAVAGRATREVGLVFATVLVGQVLLGWHNDLVDAKRDAAHDRPRKPIAQGKVDSGNVWFTLACGVLLLVPLAVANGVEAGIAYLASVAIGFAANAGLLRRTRYSYLTWMVSFALLPAFVSYGGWGGASTGGGPPTILVTALVALLGVGVHVLTSLRGLVDDNADGIRHLPLRIALKTGAPRLLLLSGVYTGAVSVAIVIAALTVGIVQ